MEGRLADGRDAHRDGQLPHGDVLEALLFDCLQALRELDDLELLAVEERPAGQRPHALRESQARDRGVLERPVPDLLDLLVERHSALVLAVGKGLLLNRRDLRRQDDFCQ